jgi:hypothetical protein
MNSQILEKLFNSKNQVKVMKFLINNSEEKFQVSELAKKIKVNRSTTQKELNKLQKIKFVLSALKKRKKHYFLNQNFVLYPEIKKMFLKVEPPENSQLLKQIKRIGGVKLAALGGIFVGNKKNQADIMVVGEKMNSRKLKAFFSNLEAELGQEINYTLMNVQEFFYRQNMCDKFLIDFFEKPHKVLIDKLKRKKEGK